MVVRFGRRAEETGRRFYDLRSFDGSVLVCGGGGSVAFLDNSAHTGPFRVGFLGCHRAPDLAADAVGASGKRAEGEGEHLVVGSRGGRIEFKSIIITEFWISIFTDMEFLCAGCGFRIHQRRGNR